MAINSDSTNKLYSANDTSVKFYASLTRNQALGTQAIGVDEDSLPVYVEPGAICFVSDDKGNSIFLNNLLFGDGAKSGSGGGGGITEVNLSDLIVVTKDGETLKTLADYFKADGTFISESFEIYETKQDALGLDYLETVFKIDSTGIYIGSQTLLEYILNEITSATPTILASAQAQADQALADAKSYTDLKLTTIYTPKGSVATHADLVNISDPQNGWVYNVTAAYKPDPTNNPSYIIPAGTNYAYIKVDDQTDSKYPGYWDALGGTVDLSAYKTSSATTTEIEEKMNEAKEYTDTKVGELATQVSTNTSSISNLSSDYQTLNSQVGTNTTNISTNASNIEQNTTNITNISTQLTWQ